MNHTPMLLDDAEIIARLRAALDEVAATAPVPSAAGERDGDADAPGGSGASVVVRRLGGATPFGDRGAGGGDRRRWLAAAAAIAVLGGATVWALTGRHPSDEQDPAATAPATIVEPATVAVTTPASIPDPDASAVDLPATSAPWSSDPTQVPLTTVAASQPHWFAVTDPSLTPGPVTREPVSTDTTAIVQSWTVTTAAGPPALLTGTVFQELQESLEGDYATQPVEVDDGTAFLLTPNGLDGTPLTYGYQVLWYRSDGASWLFRSQGLTPDELLALVRQAVPGSGLPIVIPDPSAAFLMEGTRADSWIGQTYTGQGLNGPGTVQLRVVNDGTALDNIVGAANVVDVTIAGTAGWAAELGNGSIEAVWEAGDGWWGVVTVSAQLARAADGIFASVVPADPALIPPA